MCNECGVIILIRNIKYFTGPIMFSKNTSEVVNVTLMKIKRGSLDYETFLLKISIYEIIQSFALFMFESNLTNTDLQLWAPLFLLFVQLQKVDRIEPEIGTFDIISFCFFYCPRDLFVCLALFHWNKKAFNIISVTQNEQ